jgi:hypothetical protein
MTPSSLLSHSGMTAGGQFSPPTTSLVLETLLHSRWPYAQQSTRCSNHRHALSPSVSGACILVVHWRLFARGQDQSQSCVPTKAISMYCGRVAAHGRFGPTVFNDFFIQITSVGQSARIQAEQSRNERASTSRIDDWSIGHVWCDWSNRQRARYWSELCRAIRGPFNECYVNTLKEPEQTVYLLAVNTFTKVPQ